MLGKTKASFFILALLYVAIIILALIFCILLVWFTFNLTHQIRQWQINLQNHHCQIYLKFNRYGFYQRCLAEAQQ